MGIKVLSLEIDGAASDTELSLRTGRPGTAGTAWGRTGEGTGAGAGGSSWKIGSGEGRIGDCVVAGGSGEG